MVTVNSSADPPTLWTTAEAGLELGVSARRVRQLIAHRRLGQRYPGGWLLSEADIEVMRVRVPGRPRKRARAVDVGSDGGRPVRSS